MTHRQILELAGRFTEHGATILRQCRGISVAALRRYLKARQTQCREWSQILDHSPVAEGPGVMCSAASWDDVRPALQEIATGGILLRVASTVLHAIGNRLDIPLAIDVAGQTARAFDGVVQRAMAFVAVREDISCSQLVALDKLGQLADRMSDLLCGALLPTLQCDRFLVDRERARDFAETFGRDRTLVRVPIQQCLKRLPHDWHSVHTATEVERALGACLQIPTEGAAPVSGMRQLAQATELRVIGQKELDTGVSEASPPRSSTPLSFPSHSFARSRQRLRDSIRG
jgi:hypothetical protein